MSKLTEAEMAQVVTAARSGAEYSNPRHGEDLYRRALLQQSEALTESERRIQELEAVCVGHNTRARSWQLQSEKLAGEKGAAEAQVAALTKRVLKVEAQVTAQQVLDWMEARKGTSWKASIGDVEKVMNAIKFEREERATLSTPKEGGGNGG